MSLASDMRNYPHLFDNDPEKFKWQSSPAACNTMTDRQMFPLIKGNTFDGTAGQDDANKFRVVFIHARGSADATYCGTIYHTGTANGFSPCNGCSKKRGEGGSCQIDGSGELLSSSVSTTLATSTKSSSKITSTRGTIAKTTSTKSTQPATHPTPKAKKGGH